MGLTGLRPSSSKDKESSKSNRKFDKKLEFYSKVRDTVATLGAKKTIGKKKKLRSRQKKLKAYDLSDLTEFLPELKNPQQHVPTNLKLNCKTRQKLVEKEGKQMKTVLSHPAFQLNPLAAIHQHLEGTQPAPVEKPKERSKKCGSKKKGKKSKTSSGARSMDM